MHAPTAALLALALLASGCATAPAPASSTHSATATATSAVLPNATLAPEPPARLEIDGCRQLHTFFPFPVAALAQLGFQLPEGFTFATTDPAGAAADVFVAWWFCKDGQLNHTLVPRFGPNGAMLAAIHVVPPPVLANASVDIDLLPLTWLLSSSTAANYLAALDGLDGVVESGDVVHSGTNSIGAAVTDSGQASPSFGTFGVDTAVQAAPAAAPLSVYRVWQAPEGTATGFLEVRNLPGTTVGTGVADLRFAGDPTTGAPPIIPGQSHVVDGVDLVLVPQPLGTVK